MGKPWYMKSLADLEAEARSGHGHAIALYAQAFARGLRGAKIDADRACTLLEQAAAAGSGYAACSLGDVFSREKDDPAKARSWWLRAAALGDPNAMSNLIDGSGSEEEMRFLVQAAELGQPFARQQLRELHAGGRKPPPTLEAFARTPLADLAKDSNDAELDVSFTLRGSLEAINDLAGRWVEGVAELWPALVVEADSDGAPIDFPAPQAPDISEDIELVLKSGCRMLMADLGYDEDDEEWSLSITSFEPHPTPAEAKRFLAALKAAAKASGLKLKAA